MKIAILGGTYNPVHVGHLLLAKEIQNQFDFDKILLIPSHTPAHKIIDDDISVSDRVEMLKLALQELGEGFYLDKCEILNERISYSIDTINCVAKKYNLTQPPSLVIGDDVFVDFDKWKNPDEIIKKADLLIAHRVFEHKINSTYPHKYINNKILNVSSSEIRKRVKENKPIDFLVPKEVIKYIQENKLYKK